MCTAEEQGRVLWNVFIRALALIQHNKTLVWKAMWTMTLCYFIFAWYAIIDEAILNGLPADTSEDFSHLIASYPRFIFNALITSLLGVFSGDSQFPVMVLSMTLIIYVYQLTIIRRR